MAMPVVLASIVWSVSRKRRARGLRRPVYPALAASQTETRHGARNADHGRKDHGPQPECGEAFSSARIQLPKWLEPAAMKRQHRRGKAPHSRAKHERG